METLEPLIRKGLSHFAVEFNDQQLRDISSYIYELGRWNQHMNLVGIKELRLVVTDLVFDAFFLHSRLQEGQSVLDLGSGAGVVAIPLAVLGPRRTVFSVDKIMKKVQFQRHVKRMLGLANLEVLYGRIEDIPPIEADVLVAKALGSTSAVLDMGRKHLRHGGKAFLLKGANEEASSEKGFLLDEATSYCLPETRKDYQLFAYKKIS
jgi:16S rRNA (guanine527-N7)-methyltransferase